jgi:hypothetical protein
MPEVKDEKLVRTIGLEFVSMGVLDAAYVQGSHETRFLSEVFYSRKESIMQPCLGQIPQLLSFDHDAN